MQRQQEEMQRQQEKKRREIERLEIEKEVNKARAQFEVYDRECRGLNDSSDIGHSLDKAHKDTIEVKKDRAQKTLRKSAQVSEDGQIAVLVRSLQDCMSLHRLPPPEPSVFTGEAIRYVEWKASFKTLIESKAISTAERVYYLKRYLGGEALKAVQGFFYNTSIESYEGAWQLLQERWQKISPKDATGLQQFADFLKACNDAIPHVPALKILDDCEETDVYCRSYQIGRQLAGIGKSHIGWTTQATILVLKSL